MKILISCQFFNYCSGSATYVYDLAVELVKRGHSVTVLSQIGGEISNAAGLKGIRLLDFSQIFEIQDETFDIMHLNQSGPAELTLAYFDFPAVMTLHSSLGIESPFIHNNIKHYIAAKPSEVETFKELTPILIDIGVDFERFNTKGRTDILAKKEELGIKKEVVAFIGSFDMLREQSLYDLIKKSKEEDFEIIYIGQSMLKHGLPEEISKVPETFFIEKWIESVDKVASILIGRTAIEAWACGKDYYCYDVDSRGNIKSVTLMPPPEDMTKYDIKTMTTEIEKLYQSAITAPKQ